MSKGWRSQKERAKAGGQKECPRAGGQKENGEGWKSMEMSEGYSGQKQISQVWRPKRERSVKGRTLREGRGKGEGGGGGGHFPASLEQVLHKFLPQPETGIKFSRNFCWNFSLPRRYVLNKKE
jgi:hypothetical protein